jgi:hypothetical protein
MNPALIFEAHHKNYVKLQSKDFAKMKMKKNTIEKNLENPRKPPIDT